MRFTWFAIFLTAAIHVCAVEYDSSEVFVPGKSHNGFLGLTVGADSMLYAGNISNGRVFKIDPKFDDTTLFQGSPIHEGAVHE
jgi:hypothetical protein